LDDVHASTDVIAAVGHACRVEMRASTHSEPSRCLSSADHRDVVPLQPCSDPNTQCGLEPWPFGATTRKSFLSAIGPKLASNIWSDAFEP
jgi:hypothetical protein